ncbi:MAG: AAA family ATPase [archaeon]
MIKELELQGFKSFDRHISIPLSSGFTAVVGPNGSGKSNICDAICFVLGLSSASSMRAERLTHLIYNGGKNKAPANFMEVSLILDNKEKKLPFDEETVKISRRLTRKGTMAFKINGNKTTRTQVTDILSTALFNPQGHNIVLQGDITNFIEMSPLQRRQILDEICGISEYDEKRDKAKKDLDEVESRIKELVIVMSERKKHLEDLEKEKNDAERYNSLKKEATELEASLAFTKLKKIEAESSKTNEKLTAENSKFSATKKELEVIDTTLSKNDNELKNLDTKIIKEGGEEQLGVKFEVARLHSQISIGESKIESKQSEISRLDTLVTKMQSLSTDKAGDRVISLKEEVQGIHGTVGELLRVEPKYERAIKSAMGNRVNFIVVDNEEVALKCVDFLKKNRLGRATFLPLNKIRGPEIKDMKTRGVVGLAVNLVEFDFKYKNIFSYILGNTYIVDKLRDVKSLIGRFRMVSLDGDIAEKSGAVTGGSYKKDSNESSGVDELAKGRDKLLDEIEETKLELDSWREQLEKTEQKAEEIGADFNNLQKKRTDLQAELDRMKLKRGELASERELLQQIIGDLRVEKARIDAQLSDAKNSMKRFETGEFKEGDLRVMEKRLSEISKEITALEPVNMKAIEMFAEAKGEYESFNIRFTKLQDERRSVLEFIAEIEGKKKYVFMEVYTKVSTEFSAIFPHLSPNGEAKLLLEDQEDPLAGGIIVEAKPAGKKLLSIDSMSGGEKVITALAFLFALQKYKPAPFYVLDEVDAALDQANSMRFVNMLTEVLGNAQILVISHNNSVIKKAERLYGVSMTAEGTSRIVGIELGDAETAKKYTEQPKGTKAEFNPKMEEIARDE